MNASQLSELLRFRTEATPAHFAQIFGSRLGSHLWDRYVANNYDLLGLLATLDSSTLTRFGRGIGRTVKPTPAPDVDPDICGELFA